MMQKKHHPLGYYARQLGLLFLVAISSACGDTQTSDQLVQEMATKQALMGSESDAKYVTDDMKYTTVTIQIFGKPYATGALQESSVFPGMGVITHESDNNNGQDTLSILSPDHVVYVGQHWASFKFSSAYGLFQQIIVDPDIGAKNGPVEDPTQWYIVDIHPFSSGITEIIFHKPDSAPNLTQGHSVDISTIPPVEDNVVLVIQAPYATGFSPVVTQATVVNTLFDPETGVPMIELNKPATHSASGGPVFDIRTGDLTAFILGAPPGNNIEHMVATPFIDVAK